MSTLARAFEIASEIHKGQFRWDGKTPYIFHCLRVCFKMDTDEEKTVAILHDAIEDHPDRISFDILEKEGFSKDVIESLVLLTHDKKDDYEQYIKYVGCGRICRKVKIADLEDNMRLDEVGHISEKHRERLNKYLKAHRYLKSLQ
jgi:(p)ppGpp synthase/HD superfamily hydrolase